MNLSDIDRAYSPSYFLGNSQPPAEALDQFKSTQESCYQQNLKTVPIIADLCYCSTEEAKSTHTLDVWGNKDVERIVAFVHGGYWRFGNKRHCSTIVPPLIQNGYAMASIGYVLAPKQTILQMVHQIHCAIVFLSKKFPNAKICISGHSAGAHLVAKAIELGMPENVDKVVLFCGVYYLHELVDTYIGKDINLTKGDANEASIDNDKIIEKIGDRKILIMTAAHEAPKLLSQVKTFTELLSSRSINFQHQTIDDTNHFTLIEQLQNPEASQTRLLLDFIE